MARLLNNNVLTRSASLKKCTDSTAAVKDESINQPTPNQLFKTPSMKRLNAFKSFSKEISNAYSTTPRDLGLSPRIALGIKPWATPKESNSTLIRESPRIKALNLRKKKWYQPDENTQPIVNGKNDKVKSAKGTGKRNGRQEIDDLLDIGNKSPEDLPKNDSFSFQLIKLNSIEEAKVSRSPPKKKGAKAKKKKCRHDVVYKTILRECRRFYQTKVNELTGFVTSKKIRTDDSMYNKIEHFNQEFLRLNGTFEENFYLAALLYPQDLIRNIGIFLNKSSEKLNGSNSATNNADSSLAKKYTKIVNRIHDTLYKYSHDKLDYFVSIPQLSFLF